jgi:hypothetical protein
MPRGDAPGFRDAAAEDYALITPMPAAPLAVSPDLLPTFQYVKHQRGTPRAQRIRIGAFGD